jgi:predicted DNA-binding WGR domain protein
LPTYGQVAAPLPSAERFRGLSVGSIRNPNRRRSIDSKYALDARAVSRLSFEPVDEQTKDPDVLNVLVLERVDRTKNMARYYVLSVEPTLFAEWSLVRRWGRIGGAGRTRIDVHASPPLAQIALNTWLERKRRRGYRLRA